jgi:hypothetical protein
MVDFYEFDTTPLDEMGVQVSSSTDYMPAMRTEAKRMLEICRKLWPSMEWGIKSNPHDFGSYLSIIVKFNDDDETVWDYINKIENEWPSTWDECNQRIAQLTEKDEAI